MKTQQSIAAALSMLLFQLSALAFVVLSSAAVDQPPKSSVRKSVVVLGDSIAAGYGLEPGESFPAVLQKKIDALTLPFVVVNAGVSGDTTASGLRRVDWLLKRPMAVLIIELGGNDGLRGISPAETKSNLDGIIKRVRARQPEVEIILAGMRMPPNVGTEYAREFENVFPAVAKENQVALIPFVLEGVGGREEFNLEDRIHPTAEGQKLVAENIWRVLQPVLEQARAK